MKKPLIIGLTGGIGSGKTTIAKYFQSHGIPVYFADDEAKKILNEEITLQEVKQKLGNDLVKNNILNKQKLSKLVFDNPEKLKILNEIIHPLVKKNFDNWVKEHKKFQFVIKEAAILFESGSYKYCDKIINVFAPIEERINRVMKRDKSDKTDVLARIKNQWTDEERSSKSDFNITNTTINDAFKQADEILKTLNIL